MPLIPSVIIAVESAEGSKLKRHLAINVTDASFKKPLRLSLPKCLYKCSCIQDSFLSNFLALSL